MTPFEALGTGKIEILNIRQVKGAENPTLTLKSRDVIDLVVTETKSTHLYEGDRLLIPDGVTMVIRFPDDAHTEPVLLQGKADGGIVDEDGMVKVTTERKLYNLNDHDMTIYPTKSKT